MATLRKQANALDFSTMSPPCSCCQTPVFRPLMAGRNACCPVCEAPWADAPQQEALRPSTLADVA
ncbi:MAG: hypothetical protein OEW39_07210 [Deltaproteobacteria bacterium]|nr:hypothetical protein [Deltaproteobacteria bacterium]